MAFWRRLTGKIKREISAEDVSWFIVGGLATRQLKAALFLFPPMLITILFVPDGSLKTIVVGVLGGVWILSAIVLYAIGTVFLGKKMDRYYNRHVRPKLSKEYRKR